MNRERWVGLAVILLVIGGFLFLRNRNSLQLTDEMGSTDQLVSEFAEEMGVVLPDDVEKATLEDISGGSSKGLATRKFTEGTFTHSVLAALPDPETGSWYEGWLVRENPFDVIYTGKLRQAKGGWVLDFVSVEDLQDHQQVVVTLEKVEDGKPESHILEGAF